MTSTDNSFYKENCLIDATLGGCRSSLARGLPQPDGASTNEPDISPHALLAGRPDSVRRHPVIA
jgi:hypothetical protein